MDFQLKRIRITFNKLTYTEAIKVFKQKIRDFSSHLAAVPKVRKIGFQHFLFK